MQLTEKQKFKLILEELDLSHADLAEVLGLTKESVNAMINKAGSFPKWAKIMVFMYESLIPENISTAQQVFAPKNLSTELGSTKISQQVFTPKESN